MNVANGSLAIVVIISSLDKKPKPGDAVFSGWQLQSASHVWVAFDEEAKMGSSNLGQFRTRSQTRTENMTGETCRSISDQPLIMAFCCCWFSENDPASLL